MNNKSKLADIKKLLIDSGFYLVEKNSYANDRCCVCISYHKKNEILIVGNSGNYIGELNFCIYALIGWFAVNPSFGTLTLSNHQ